MDQRPDEQPLMDDPLEAPEALNRIRIDTITGMLASNLIAVAIMIATAATLHQHGVTNITRPLTPPRRSSLSPDALPLHYLALASSATGLLAIPVLAGSTGYAVAEAAGWKTGLDNMPWQARGFYSVIGAACDFGPRYRLVTRLTPLRRCIGALC